MEELIRKKKIENSVIIFTKISFFNFASVRNSAQSCAIVVIVAEVPAYLHTKN